MARNVRSTDERVAEIDQKIEKKKQEIKALEERKNKILNPVSMRSVISRAKELGMKPEEIAKKLGIDV